MRHVILIVLLVGTVGSAGPGDSAMDVDQRATAHRVGRVLEAGRDLTPKSWPNGRAGARLGCSRGLASDAPADGGGGREDRVAGTVGGRTVPDRRPWRSSASPSPGRGCNP